MKIAQLTGFFWPRKYGSNELILCRELAKRGHKVTLITAMEPPNEYSMLNEYAPRTESYEGFIIKRFPSVLKFGNILFIPSALHFLLENEFDIIHSHEFFAPCSFYSAIASMFKRVPLIITQHNDSFPQTGFKGFLYSANAATVGKIVLSRAEKVIALSQGSFKHIESFGVNTEKMEVIPNGVDIENFNPNKTNYLETKWGISHPVILYVGRFFETKGIHYLLEAFTIIAKEIPTVKLVLVGSGPLQNEVDRFKKRFEGRIFSIGLVKYQEMPNIYTGCDVFVMPSIEERFGNSVIEAMAAGKPSIGTYTGGIKYTIVHGETGFHVQTRNSEQLAYYILKILRDQNLARRLSKNARNRAVEVFGNEILIKRIEESYLSAIQKVCTKNNT
jgi:glycosyltransferase involved in cell wall biosynthesis